MLDEIIISRILSRRKFVQASVSVVALTAILECGDKSNPYRGNDMEKCKDAHIDTANMSGLTEQLAHEIDMTVSKESGYKGGWSIKILELCAPNKSHLVTGENEPCLESKDQKQLLTTSIDISCNEPQIIWKRDDAMTTMVDNQGHVNYMGLYFDDKPDLMINNVAGDGGKRQQYVRTISDLGMDLDGIFDCVNCTSDQMQKWLRGESDPFSITTIHKVNTDAFGNMIYDVGLFRVDLDDVRTRVLTAQLNFATGLLKRIDSRSKLGGFYSKIFAWIPGTDGFEIKKYGVDTETQNESHQYMPELLAESGPYK